MKALTAEDSAVRLIDSAAPISDEELETLLADGWRLVRTEPRVSRNGGDYTRYVFHHVTVLPPRGARGAI
jgi:hypothetical protein